MKRVAIIVSVLIGLLALAAIALVMRPPTGMIAQRLADQVRQATGRDFTVKGLTTVNLGWRLKVRMDDVTLANPAGMAGDPLLWARAIEVETPTVPALTGRSATIEVLRVVDPRVSLVRDAAGVNNWTITTAGPSTFAVGELQFAGARLAYSDASAKDSAVFEGLDGTANDVSAKRIGGFAFTGAKANIDLAGATAVLDKPSLAGKQVTPDAIGELDVKGATLTLAGLGDGMEARLDGPNAHAARLAMATGAPVTLGTLDVKATALTAKLPDGASATLEALDAHAAEVKSEHVGTLALKAGGARYASGDGLDVALDTVAAEVKALSPEEIGGLVLDAKAVRYKLADGASGTIDAAHAEQRNITPESIAELSLKGDTLKHAGAAGLGVELAGFAASGKGLTPGAIGGLVVDARTLGYRLEDGASGSFATLHADGHGIKTNAADDLMLTSTTLQHAMANGSRLELAGLEASGKALTTQSIGEASVAAAQFAAIDGDARYELVKLAASTKDAKLPGPIDATLAFDWKGERVSSAVKLDQLAWPTDAKPLPLNVRLDARGSQLTIDGTLSSARQVEGQTSLTSKSLRELAKWLDVELPTTGPLAATKVEGRVKATTKRLELSDAALALDATKARGSLTVDISGARPRITGTLAADSFDADAYGITKPPKRTGAPVAAALAAEDAPSPPATLKEALKVYARAELERIEQEKAGGGQSAAAAAARKAPPPAWSDEPFDFGFLKTADLDLALACDKLRIAGLDVGVPTLKAKLDDGVLSLDGRDLTVRGGKVTGRAAVEARDGAPRAAANIKADNVEALDLFDALGLTSMVAGKSSIEADLGGGVASQKKLVESVTGSVKVKMGRGSVIGYDPGEILTYIMGNGRYDAKRRWPFSRLDADMSLDKGLSKNTKVVVDTAVAAANSDGTTNLPKREIDYQAKLNVSFWFQPILVRIFGAWNSPKWAADMFDTSRGATLESAANLRRLDIKDPELATMLGDLIAKSPGSAEPLDPAVLDTLRVLQTQAEGK